LRRARDAGRICDIQLDKAGLGAIVLQNCSGLISRFTIARGEKNVKAFPGQLASRFKSNPFVRAGDQGGLGILHIQQNNNAMTS
jgi:hypothetical protein